MSLARTDARTAVKYRLGNRSDLTDAQLDGWGTDGLVELSTRIRIGNLEATDTTLTYTSGSATLAFPTNFVAVTHIFNTTQARPLKGPIEWLRLRNQQIVAGDPTLWAARANVIYFNKKADSSNALDIAGQKRPSWATTDAATPSIDVEYEYGILLLATLHAARALGNMDVAFSIEDPRRGGLGEFMNWVRQNNFPLITQDLQPAADGVRVNLTGYAIVE